MGLASFFKALPRCIGIYDPVKEEDDCEVCHTSKFQEIDFDGKDITTEEGMLKVNGRVKIVNDIRPAGEHHWLILPREHIRDVEQLQAKDLDLCEPHRNSLTFMKRLINKRVSVVLEMRSVRAELLRRHCSATDRVHCGYHRARERMLGPIHTIDRISVPHLHLHVIARPHEDIIPDKYSHWFVWTSEEEVFERVEKMAKASMERVDVSLGQEEHLDATSAKNCTSTNLDKT
ncbi:hypothetical protein V8C44DRAFT_332052 [Trichoderma aethiopicum]